MARLLQFRVGHVIVMEPSLLLQLREQHQKDPKDDLIITNKPASYKRRSSITRMSIDEKEKILHSSSVEEKGTALTDRIQEDGEIGAYLHRIIY